MRRAQVWKVRQPGHAPAVWAAWFRGELRAAASQPEAFRLAERLVAAQQTSSAPDIRPAPRCARCQGRGGHTGSCPVPLLQQSLTRPDPTRPTTPR